MSSDTGNVPKVVYLSEDGKTYHDANGNVVPTPEPSTTVQLTEEDLTAKTFIPSEPSETEKPVKPAAPTKTVKTAKSSGRTRRSK